MAVTRLPPRTPAAKRKSRHTLAQKATFDAAHAPQPIATPTQMPTRHTRQTRRQALAPASPVLRAPGPERISLPSLLSPPPEATSPPTRLRLPKDLSLLRLPPEAEASPFRLQCAARSRRETETPEAGSPSIRPGRSAAPAFPGVSAKFGRRSRCISTIRALRDCFVRNVEHPSAEAFGALLLTFKVKKAYTRLITFYLRSLEACHSPFAPFSSSTPAARR